jgi:hypothetical protein
MADRRGDPLCGTHLPGKRHRLKPGTLRLVPIVSTPDMTIRCSRQSRSEMHPIA